MRCVRSGDVLRRRDGHEASMRSEFVGPRRCIEFSVCCLDGMRPWNVCEHERFGAYRPRLFGMPSRDNDNVRQCFSVRIYAYGLAGFRSRGAFDRAHAGIFGLRDGRCRMAQRFFRRRRRLRSEPELVLLDTRGNPAFR